MRLPQVDETQGVRPLDKPRRLYHIVLQLCVLLILFYILLTTATSRAIDFATSNTSPGLQVHKAISHITSSLDTDAPPPFRQKKTDKRGRTDTVKEGLAVPLSFQGVTRGSSKETMPNRRQMMRQLGRFDSWVVVPREEGRGSCLLRIHSVHVQTHSMVSRVKDSYYDHF